jgi:hypothetical protein
MGVSASSLGVLVPTLGQIARSRPTAMMARILPELLKVGTEMPDSYTPSQVCVCVRVCACRARLGLNEGWRTPCKLHDMCHWMWARRCAIYC